MTARNKQEKDENALALQRNADTAADPQKQSTELVNLKEESFDLTDPAEKSEAPENPQEEFEGLADPEEESDGLENPQEESFEPDNPRKGDGDFFTFQIEDARAGERIDLVIAGCMPGQSRNYLKKLIKDECVRLNGKIPKPSTPVKGGDLVEVLLPPRMMPEILPEDIPLEILYEDEDVLVVNKPKGMVVHPAAGHYSGTLVNAVLHHCGSTLSGINGVLRPGIVHRIDMDTTGSVLVCKNDAAHRSIAAQLAEHSIVRRYRAIVVGNIREDSLTIAQPIGRDPSDRKKMAVRSGGKNAVTHVRVLERFGAYTYVECRLETGRTHQIRVHLAWCHHPLLGDNVYGSRKKSPFATQGQCLHAQILGFVHPSTGAYIETQAPLPDYFESILQKLRSNSSQ